MNWFKKNEEYLEKFGFKFKSSQTQNQEEVLEKTFTKNDIKRIMNFGNLGFWLFCKRKFKISYWQKFYLKKLKDVYMWDWYDCTRLDYV